MPTGGEGGWGVTPTTFTTFLSPVTLNSDHDLDTVELNHHGKYVGQWLLLQSYRSDTQNQLIALTRVKKVKVTASHTPHRALGPKLIPVDDRKSSTRR